MATSIQIVFPLWTVLGFFFIFSNFPLSTLSMQEKDAAQLFKEFIVRYNKSYTTNHTEYAKRFINFKLNIESAELLNSDYHFNGKSAVHGINKFSDLSSEEFQDFYLSGYKPKTSLRFQSFFTQPKPFDAKKVPQKIDWRTKGVVTDVKNQGPCGACWAFSVSEVMESMLSIQFNSSLELLSVQELIDCDLLDNGCQGGDICSSTRWASRYGVVKESYYPTTDKTGTCKNLPDSILRVQVHTYACERYVNKEKEILTLLAHGPVAVAVDANSWHSYVQGVIQYHCSGIVNHAVVIVGYDLTGDVPYYIVRNSWGSDFGADGYLYIKIGDNLCEIASEVVSLTVDVPN